MNQYSDDWLEVEEWANRELELSREIIEIPGTGNEETEFQRGRISALRELLELPKEKQGKPVSDGTVQYT